MRIYREGVPEGKGLHENARVLRGGIGAFPVDVIAAQTRIRIESAMLFCELLVMCPTAESQLNKLQYEWACLVLGVGGHGRLRRHLAIVQCGWEVRLGTRALELAVVARARLFLFPDDHPGAMMLRAALGSTAVSWLSCVRLWMEKISPGGAFKDIVDYPKFSDTRSARPARTSLYVKMCFVIIGGTLYDLFLRSTTDVSLRWRPSTCQVWGCLSRCFIQSRPGFRWIWCPWHRINRHGGSTGRGRLLGALVDGR